MFYLALFCVKCLLTAEEDKGTVCASDVPESYYLRSRTVLIFSLTLFDMYRGGLCIFDHSIGLSETCGN